MRLDSRCANSSSGPRAESSGQIPILICGGSSPAAPAGQSVSNAYEIGSRSKCRPAEVREPNEQCAASPVVADGDDLANRSPTCVRIVSNGYPAPLSGAPCRSGRGGSEARTAEQAKKIIRAVARFRSIPFGQSNACGQRTPSPPARSSTPPAPLGLRGASAVAAQLARRAARARKT